MSHYNNVPKDCGGGGYGSFEYYNKIKNENNFGSFSSYQQQSQQQPNHPASLPMPCVQFHQSLRKYLDEDEGDENEEKEEDGEKTKTSKSKTPTVASSSIKLLSNYYRFTVKDLLVYQYDVCIQMLKPKRKSSNNNTNRADVDNSENDDDDTGTGTNLEVENESTNVNLKHFIRKHSSLILDKMRQTNPTVFSPSDTDHSVFDGYKNLYTVKLYQFPSNQHCTFTCNVVVSIDNRIIPFRVHLQYVDCIEMDQIRKYYESGDGSSSSKKTILTNIPTTILDTLFRKLCGEYFAQFRGKFYDTNIDDLDNDYNVDVGVGDITSSTSNFSSCPPPSLSSSSAPVPINFVPGFAASVQRAEFGLAFNMHCKIGAIFNSKVSKLTDLLTQMFHIDGGGNSDVQLSMHKINIASDLLRHLRIFTTHTGRTRVYIIDRLMYQTPYTMSFDMMINDDDEEGDDAISLSLSTNHGDRDESKTTTKTAKKMTIAEYFFYRYQIQLTHWPLIRTIGRRKCFLPLELCKLEPKQFVSFDKLNTRTGAEMLRAGRLPPNLYFNRLNTMIQRVAKLNVPLQQQYDLRLTVEPAEVHATILPTPPICSGRRIDRFVQPSTLIRTTEWAVFCLDTTIGKEELDRFVRHLISAGERYGVRFESPFVTAMVSIQNIDSLRNMFCNIQTRMPQVKLVLIGLPFKHDRVSTETLYQVIKHYTDQQEGYMSQCFKTHAIRYSPFGYLETLMMKINAKLDGKNALLHTNVLNSMIPFDMARTMMVGIDMNHPATMERIMSSIAVVVGSIDANFSTYHTSLCAQKMMDHNDHQNQHNHHPVKALKGMITEVLEAYKMANQYYPDTIVVFRSGISNTKISSVFELELQSIDTALRDIGRRQETKLIWLYVQKTHHTRVACTEPVLMKEEMGRALGQRANLTYNIPSGTVVDCDIVDPEYKMFYLNSHFSLLGTSKPAKYIVLLDEHRMNSFDLKCMCFCACHNSARMRTPLSMPTPIRYAELAARRSKQHIEAQRIMIEDIVRRERHKLMMKSKSGDGDGSGGDENMVQGCSPDGTILSMEQQLYLENFIIRQLCRSIQINSSIKSRLYYA